MVPNSPEKAGVGGSIPSLATCFQSLVDTPNGGLVPIGPKNLNANLAWTRLPSVFFWCFTKASFGADASAVREARVAQTRMPPA